MNTNPFLGQILGGVFRNAAQRRGGATSAFGSNLGTVAVGSILAGMLGRRAGAARGLGANRGALIAMLLPLAMQWVQRNGGLGAVLKRFQEKGYGTQAKSWVSTGANEQVDPRAIDDVIGEEELAQLAQRFGVPQEDVKQAFAEIVPELVNQLTPAGQVQPEADGVLDESIPLMQHELQKAETEELPH